MKIEPLNLQDLEKIRHLQPPDWPDIFPSIEFYVNAHYCYPVKCVVDDVITGIGTTIIHGHTAWLAHIIVDPNHRNRGIGSFITKSLVDSLHDSSCHTILLLATKLGTPVYQKIGFEKESEYVFFRDGKTPSRVPERVIPFSIRHQDEIFALDHAVSGENRRKLLEPHLSTSLLIIENNELQGFYMPSLGEGLIIARTEEAGISLMSLKHLDGRKAALPEESMQGIDFLLQHGYKEVSRGARMRLGKRILWQPDKIYGRIGGNLG